ncbi:MAG: flagellar basal body P-ring formation chaperone FlgA [Gammaproteobacteria bacterium]
MSAPRKLPITLLLGLALTHPVLAATGVEPQPSEDILGAGRVYLEQAARAQHTGRIEVQMGHLDPRLRLARCALPLESFQPAGARPSGRTSVGVRCNSDAGWTLYIPAEVILFATALVTTRAVARGAALKAGDVRLIETPVSGLGAGFLGETAELDDKVTRRPLPAGSVLTPAMLKTEQLVRRGDRVTLVSGEGPIQVEMRGEAINDGARGERVRVRALNSQRIVEGWVVSASVVKVTL